MLVSNGASGPFFSRIFIWCLLTIQSFDFTVECVWYPTSEYVATGLATEKVDIYSFGVVLLELVTGRHPCDNLFKDSGISLPQSVRNWPFFSVVSSENLLIAQPKKEACSHLLERSRDYCCAAGPQHDWREKSCSSFRWLPGRHMPWWRSGRVCRHCTILYKQSTLSSTEYGSGSENARGPSVFKTFYRQWQHCELKSQTSLEWERYFMAGKVPNFGTIAPETRLYRNQFFFLGAASKYNLQKASLSFHQGCTCTLLFP